MRLRPLEINVSVNYARLSINIVRLANTLKLRGPGAWDRCTAGFQSRLCPVRVLDPRLECGNHIVHRLAAWGPYGQRFELQLVKINSDQRLPMLVVRARQAVTLDHGARPLGRDVEALGNLHVGELFEHPAGHHPSGWAPSFVVMPRGCSPGGRKRTASMVDERLTLSRAEIANPCGCQQQKIGR